MLSDFRRSVRLELIGRSADILFFTLLVIQKELSSPNCLRRLHNPKLGGSTSKDYQVGGFSWPIVGGSSPPHPETIGF